MFRPMDLKLFAFCAFWAVLACQTIQADDVEDIFAKCNNRCGHIVNPKQSSTRFKRTAEGFQTFYNNAPWTVLFTATKLFDCKSVPSKINCTGSIVGRRHVLTAAHCLVIENPCPGATGMMTADSMTVITQPETDIAKEYKVKAAMAADGFTYHSLQNDFAVLTLETEFNYGSSIRPICLPNAVPNTWLTNAFSQYIAGFGTPLNDKTLKLRMEKVSIVQDNVCQVIWPDLAVRDDFICARGESGGSIQGDSGGPLYVDVSGTFFQLGTLSSSQTLKQSGKNIYTDVLDETLLRCEFIKEATNGEVQCKSLFQAQRGVRCNDKLWWDRNL